MKKYLGILLIMIGIILIPRNVNASSLVKFNECETVLNEELQKKITTCSYGYENTSDVDNDSFIIEMKFNPTNENTTVDVNLNAEYAVYAGDTNDDYTAIDIAVIPAQTKAKIAEIVWTADAALEDAEAGGTVLTRISSLSSGNVQITEDYGSSSSDMLVNSYTQEKIYNVTITWGSMEYDYVEKLDGTSEWTAVTDVDGMSQGYVLVENYSNVAMNAYIKFESSIEGVEANYTTDYSYYENDEEHVVSSNLDYLPLDAYVENENGYHAAVQWIVNLTGGTYDAVEEAYNNGDRKIGTVTILVGDATMGDVG